MKKLRFKSDSRPKKIAVCTVSAAALMLGVSEATTVALHFQESYCNGGGNPTAGYSGYPVTLTAFGVSTNQWESLTPMDTGYQGCSGPLGYNLSEVINTTSSGNGLNPLPNGSLSLSWFGPTANFSNFGGYAAGGPHYNYGGSYPNSGFPQTGEGQVYATFLRDGVNFGPGSSSGDNDQPGYSVDITGLKSLFTNTPFAIQLIASADSMNVLTNAFIIDASANTTQSVVYPNTPPVANVGDTTWVRGQGGGLSTGSGSFNTDHIKIVSNHPQHDTVGGTYNNAGTISGFIVTDQPVISMSPQAVPVGPGDTVTWSAYAVGVPPLAYQWLKNGTPIPGATSLSLTIAHANSANMGNYALRVTNLYGSATSAVVTVDQILSTKGHNFVVDSNPVGPQHDGVDFGATWLASSTDSLSKTRTGVMSFNGADPDQITVPGSTNFNTSTGTIMFWLQTSGNTNNLPGTIFDRNNSTGLNVALTSGGQLLVQNTVGAVYFQTDTTVADGNWHHVALVYDQSTFGTVTCYIDGVVDAATPAANYESWSWPAAQEIELGLSHDTNDFAPYTGLLDDVRIYSTELSSGQIASVYASDALVDTNHMVLQLNFSGPPTSGTTLTWKMTDVILQVAPTVNGPWTDVGVSGTTVFRTALGKTQQYFRYRGHTPVTIVTNPYLM